MKDLKCNVPDPEEAIVRIMDRYDYYGFLELVFGFDHLAKELVELAEVDDGENETTTA